MFQDSEAISESLVINDDEPVTKYRRADGVEFWAYNGMEVFYSDERMFGALDAMLMYREEIASLKAELAEVILESDSKCECPDPSDLERWKRENKAEGIREMLNARASLIPIDGTPVSLSQWEKDYADKLEKGDEY
jgi:hypothetical protein